MKINSNGLYIKTKYNPNRRDKALRVAAKVTLFYFAILSLIVIACIGRR